MARPDSCSMFDLVVEVKLTEGLREIVELRNNQKALRLAIDDARPDEGTELDGSRDEDVPPGEVLDRRFCSACRCSFECREEQMEHYKLDWHRFNLRQRLAGRAFITAEEFEKKTGLGDVSSISGSDSEDDSDGADGVVPYGDRSPARVLLQNSQGQCLRLYRCAVQNRTDGEVNVVDSLLHVSPKTLWVILMTGGGHFAGAVYEGKQVLHHKTFHRYTVRAKRGTAQSVRDAQNRNHAPKSAGSALRRYNEAALTKDIQELLKNWAEYLRRADAVFIRTLKYNRGVFFGGRDAPLEKKDSRIRSIPFATRRATFKEITRVHGVLSTLQIYDKSTDICSVLESSKRTWSKKASDQHGQSAADRVEEEEEEEVSVELLMEDVTLTTLDLREHELKPGKKKRRKKKERKPEGTREEEKAADGEDEVCVSWEFSLRDALYTACKTGDTEALHALLKQDEDTLIRLLKTPIDSAGYTLLHVASAAAQKRAVEFLLEMGSDPTCRDRKGQTPYAVARDKESRNVFRRFMAEHPNRYDYAKAQVPGPLTAEIESKKAEKKKAQKAMRKQREKEQREETRRKEEEEEEKRRFLSLSDREKRALAAERRLAEQVAMKGGTLTNVRRCWQCGESLVGTTPFEYLHYSFCSTRCVHTHRKSHSSAKP